LRHRSAVRPRSSTTCSMPASVRHRLIASPAWPAPITTVWTVDMVARPYGPALLATFPDVRQASGGVRDGPLDGGGGHRSRHADPVELLFGRGGGVARRPPPSGDPPGPLRRRGAVEVELHPVGVGALHAGGQPAELALAERRQPAPHGHATTLRLGQAELDAALQGAGEGAVPAGGGTQPEGTGRLRQIELEAVR